MSSRRLWWRLWQRHDIWITEGGLTEVWNRWESIERKRLRDWWLILR